MKIFTTIDLLEMLLNLLFIENLSRPPFENEYKRIQGNAPRLIRYQRVIALMRAYYGVIDEDHPIHSFTQGFPQSMLMTEEQRMELQMYLHESYPELRDIELRHAKHVATIFYIALQYRIRLEEAVRYSDGFLAGSKFSEAGHMICLHSIKNRDITADIDRVLLKIMGENKPSISQKNLIRDFGFPKTTDWELAMIDLQNF